MKIFITNLGATRLLEVVKLAPNGRVEILGHDAIWTDEAKTTPQPINPVKPQGPTPAMNVQPHTQKPNEMSRWGNAFNTMGDELTKAFSG